MTRRKSKTPTKRSSDRPYDPVTDYAEQVVSRTIVAGPDIRAACQRHLKDLKTAKKRGLVWRLDKALHAIGFIENICKLKDGSPFLLQLWQKFIVGSIFGWYGVDDFRRFRTAFIEIGKGNGKSPLAAAIGLYMLVSDGEPFAEVYAAASHKEQAMIAFRSAVVMRDQSPALVKRVVKNPNTQACWQLSHLASGSFFRAISSEVTSGPRIHCALVDEIHEHKTPDLIDIIRTGVGKCQRSLIFEITNSGVDRTSVCYQHHEYSQQVAAGVVEDDSWFAFVCGLDEGDDPLKDEACWIKANPNLGVSIHAKELRIAVQEAKGMPAAASKKKRLHFCMWVDAASPWIAGTAWMPCEIDGLDALDLWRGRDCVVSLDLSGTTDLTALAIVFPDVPSPVDPGRRVIGVRVEFFTPRGSLFDRARRDRVPYDLWTEQGHMTATPGMSIDYGMVADRILELLAIVNVKRIVADPYRSNDLRREFEKAGIDVEIVPHPQGVRKSEESGLWMPRSIELTEKAIFDQTLAVEPNPCLRWNVAGAVVQSDAHGNRYFTKRKAAGRIDGAVAVVQGVGAAAGIQEDSDSVYETRGVITL